MKEQLRDSWTIHHEKNLLLFDAITDEGMQKTLSTKGGRTIGQQWVHIHKVRMQWLEIIAKDVFKQYDTLDKNTFFNRQPVREALNNSYLSLLAVMEKSLENKGRVNGFIKGVIPLLGYFISHESHHRGNIMLTLKQSGEKIPDAVKWGLWEWTK